MTAVAQEMTRDEILEAQRQTRLKKLCEITEASCAKNNVQFLLENEYRDSMGGISEDNVVTDCGSRSATYIPATHINEPPILFVKGDVVKIEDERHYVITRRNQQQIGVQVAIVDWWYDDDLEEHMDIEWEDEVKFQRVTPSVVGRLVDGVMKIVTCETITIMQRSQAGEIEVEYASFQKPYPFVSRMFKEGQHAIA